MDATKREVRTLDCELSVREAAQDAQGNGRRITGTAIVFNAESVVLDEAGTKFREIISPSAVTADWLLTQDVKLNLLHERSMSIGRWNKGKGNLKLSVTERGVDFDVEAINCDLGDRAVEMIRAGVYTGCSFEFYPGEYDVLEKNGEVTIIHRNFKAVTAITIGMDPAYRQTSVNVRELAADSEDEEKDPEEEPKKEPEEEKAAPEEEKTDEPDEEKADAPDEEQEEDPEEETEEEKKQREADEENERRRLLEKEAAWHRKAMRDRALREG